MQSQNQHHGIYKEMRGQSEFRALRPTVAQSSQGSYMLIQNSNFKSVFKAVTTSSLRLI